MFLHDGLDFSPETLNDILDSVPNGIVVKDQCHRWLLVNDTLCREMGRQRSELLGRSDFDFLPGPQAERNWASDDAVLATGEPLDLESQVPDLKGGFRTIMTRKRRISLRRSDGRIVQAVLVVIVDVSRFRKAEESARFLALHDPLTRIANRLLFRQRLEEALDRGTENLVNFGLLLLDLDGFKDVNDRLGHLAGDKVLRIVAERLASSVRERDTAARLGGDEFGIIQISADQPAAAISLAGRIADAISQPMRIFGSAAVVSASIGIAHFPQDGHHADILIHRADTALYAVKRGGKNGFSLCRG